MVISVTRGRGRERRQNGRVWPRNAIKNDENRSFPPDLAAKMAQYSLEMLLEMMEFADFRRPNCPKSAPFWPKSAPKMVPYTVR